MEPRQCEKCGETVEATRAFCPGCGAAMVAEEQRSDLSAFEASAGTVQFGKTMFGKMLSDMGLNISDAPNKPSTGPPSAPSQRPTAPAIATSAETAAKGSGAKWILIVGAALILLGMLAVIAAAILVYLYSGYQAATF